MVARAASASRPPRVLFFGLRHVRVGVRRGEDQFLAVRRKERLHVVRPRPGADSPRVALVEPLNVDLIERIADRIRLIADQLSVGRKVAFARPR